MRLASVVVLVMSTTLGLERTLNRKILNACKEQVTHLSFSHSSFRDGAVINSHDRCGFCEILLWLGTKPICNDGSQPCRSIGKVGRNWNILSGQGSIGLGPKSVTMVRVLMMRLKYRLSIFDKGPL